MSGTVLLAGTDVYLRNRHTSRDLRFEWFQRLHDFPTPVDVATPLAADVATVPGQPVSFVDPTAGSTLASRLAETEQQPLAFLFSTEDFDAAAERFVLTDAGEWADRRVAWFDADLFRTGLGVLEAP